MPPIRCAVPLLLACVSLAPETRPVGVQPDGKVVVPTNQNSRAGGKAAHLL